MLEILLILFIGIKVGMPTWFWILYGMFILLKTFVIAYKVSEEVNKIDEE